MVLDADTSATRGIVMTDPSIAPARTPAEVDAIVKLVKTRTGLAAKAFYGTAAE